MFLFNDNSFKMVYLLVKCLTTIGQLFNFRLYVKCVFIIVSLIFQGPAFRACETPIYM